jgi:hypothetical protein
LGSLARGESGPVDVAEADWLFQTSGRLLSRRKKQKPSLRVDDAGNASVAARNVKHQPQPSGWRLDALVGLLLPRALFLFFDLIQNHS